MAWPKFLLFNTAGAVVWATLYGLGAYYLGHALERLTKPAAIVLGIAGILVLVALFVLTKRHEAELTAEAEEQHRRKRGSSL